MPDPLDVLVVDDALFVRTMIRDILDGTGRYRVVAEAGNGREAVRLYGKLRPRIVTMDIVMPELDGIGAIREIVAIDPRASIVVCSALGQEVLVIESIAAGARDFVVKPLTAEKLVRVLDKIAAGV